METNPTISDEISLLDVAVVLSESWKLILASVLVAGAVAFAAVGILSTPIYRTEALVQLSSDEAALLRSAQVIDPVLQKNDVPSNHGENITAARGALLRVLSVEQLGKSEIHRVSLKGTDATATRNLLSDLLAQAILQSVPSEDRAVMLKEDIAGQEEAVETLRSALAQAERNFGNHSNEAAAQASLRGVGEAIVALTVEIERLRREVQEKTRALEGTIRESDILQKPTLSAYQMGSGRLAVSAMAAALAGVLAVVFAFVREGWSRCKEDPVASGKIERIKRSFQWR